MGDEVTQKKIANRFATAEDIRVCEDLQRQYGTTYYFASRLFPAEIRPHVASVYGFVRVPDEWVDNPEDNDASLKYAHLRGYREDLRRGYEGTCPTHPVLRAFIDTAMEFSIPLAEAEVFLDAMEMDIDTTRYATYSDLEGYMRGSAVAVANMMLSVLQVERSPEIDAAAAAMANAMQLTNFIRDIGEDFVRGRIYMPQEDLDRFGVSEEDFQRQNVSSSFVRLLEFEIQRARDLYSLADASIDDLPRGARAAVRAAGDLYKEILAEVEDNKFDVFTKRARTSKAKKLILAGKAILRAR